MDDSTLFFFAKSPQALLLYTALEKTILQAWPDTKIQIKKTQINFSNRYNFAFASLPYQRRKGWPVACLLVTFGLPFRIQSERIVETSQPYLNRWTHHVLIQRPEDIDDELMGWISASYHFSATK